MPRICKQASSECGSTATRSPSYWSSWITQTRASAQYAKAETCLNFPKAMRSNHQFEALR